MMIATSAARVKQGKLPLDRADRYAEAGADMPFIQALRTREQMEAAGSSCGDRVPLLVNMVEGADTPMASAAELEQLGFAVVIFPGAMVRALTLQAMQFLETLRRDGDTRGFADRMMNFPDLQALLGTQLILEQGRRWEPFERDGSASK